MASAPQMGRTLVKHAHDLKGAYPSLRFELMGAWGVHQHGLFKKKPQSMYFVVVASFAILSYTARVTARKVRIRLAGSWS